MNDQHPRPLSTHTQADLIVSRRYLDQHRASRSQHSLYNRHKLLSSATRPITHFQLRPSNLPVLIACCLLPFSPLFRRPSTSPSHHGRATHSPQEDSAESYHSRRLQVSPTSTYLSVLGLVHLSPLAPSTSYHTRFQTLLTAMQPAAHTASPPLCRAFTHCCLCLTFANAVLERLR